MGDYEDSLYCREEVDKEEGSALKKNFFELAENIPQFMDEENRNDPSFRFAVLEDQIGDVGRHITHDPDLNKNTRPLDEPEEVAYGDAIWQLLCVAHSRDIDLLKMFEYSLERMDSKEGYKQQSNEDLSGMVACRTTDMYNGVIGEDVYMTRDFTPDTTKSISDYECIVTEIGGISCHAATVAREQSINCVVGIKSLTDNFKDGDEILVNLGNGQVKKPLK